MFHYSLPTPLTRDERIAKLRAFGFSNDRILWIIGAQDLMQETRRDFKPAAPAAAR